MVGSCFICVGILLGSFQTCVTACFLISSFSPPPLLLCTSASLPVLLSGASMAVDAETQFHVLAVDDNLIDRKVIEKLLKSSSFHGTGELIEFEDILCVVLISSICGVVVVDDVCFFGDWFL